jgi:DNA-binding MarR family transcriptional regulator
MDTQDSGAALETTMPNTRTIDWELQLGFLIHDTSRLRRSAFDRFLRPLNITRSQWWVLAHLSRGDGLTQSDIAEQLDLGRVAIGGLIDRLEKNGLVRRVADPNDRRVNRIYLDARSKPLLSRMRHANHSFNARILEGLTDEQLVTTAEALETMKRNLLKYLDSSDRARGDAAKPAGARPLDSTSSEPLAHPEHNVT